MQLQILDNTRYSIKTTIFEWAIEGYFDFTFNPNVYDPSNIDCSALESNIFDFIRGELEPAGKKIFFLGLGVQNKAIVLGYFDTSLGAHIQIFLTVDGVTRKFLLERA